MEMERGDMHYNPSCDPDHDRHGPHLEFLDDRCSSSCYNGTCDSNFKFSFKDMIVFVVVPVFVLFFWRGTWQICDIYLTYPDPELNAWMALLIGYGGLLAVLGFEVIFFDIFAQLEILNNQKSLNLPTPNRFGPGKSNSMKFKWRSIIEVIQSCKPTAEVVFMLLSRIRTYIVAFFVVQSWRGMWLLQDVYVLPSDPAMSAWISHIVGVAVLILSLHLQSALAPPALYAHDDDFKVAHYNCLFRKNSPGDIESTNAPDNSSGAVRIFKLPDLVFDSKHSSDDYINSNNSSDVRMV